MRDFSKLRKGDEKGANIVADFLDKNFYNPSCTDFERVTDVSRQVKGIDTIFTYDGVKYVCDEKASIRYVNKDLQTYSMELSFIGNMGDVRDGWLIDSHKVNDYFMFVWIDKAKKDFLTCVEDIQDLEFAVVKRSRILDYLEDLGYDLDELFEKADRLRNDYYEPKGNAFRDGCKFQVSNKLVEQPVNVIIPRKELIRISSIHKHFVK